MSVPPRFAQLHIFPDNPTAADIPLARDMVAKARQELEELRSRVAELERYVAETERIVFSINRLPPEILALMFLYSLLVSDRIPSKANAEGVWLVSQVCKHWRQVALSSQKLWSFPTIYPFVHQTAYQFNLQLSRSGSAWLHPFLTARSSPHRDTIPYLARLLKSLRGTSDRWSSLVLAFDWTRVQTRIAFMKGNVGALEELQIEGKWSGTALPQGDRLDVFANAPRLRKLSVKDVCEPAVSLVIPWHQLTHYRAIGNGHEHLAVLRRCSNLVSAHLTFSNDSSFPFDGAPVLVTLPHLLRLRVGDSEFLRILSLPSLQDIVLQKAPEGDALLQLLALTRRDHPPLTSISLVNGSLVASTLISLAEENPIIETLRIHAGRGDTAAVDELIAQLTIHPSHASCFLPNLQTLELSGRGSFDQVHFVAMVESRRRQANCQCQLLKRLVIRRTPNKPLLTDTVEALRRLARTGMSLSLDVSFLMSGSEQSYWATNVFSFV
ncbi:hypothetical protein K438DRAFT_2024813 [Mycena galopus ATCC 62051]|nr:hypothetical protein K438DRAFT_2024813 [Mycena galopus ATCC 62051]